MIIDVVEIIMDMKKDEYFGTTPILESDPIKIPNARQCRVNHGLVTAIPSQDITLGILQRRKVTLGAWKARVKSLEKRKREIEERNRMEIEKRNREIEKAILENNIER